MARPDSARMDEAVLAILQGDAELRSLIPDGVFWALAKPGVKRFGLVGLFDEADIGIQRQRAYEDAFYFVKAVGLSSVTTLPTMKAAAQRIDTLLDQATLTVADFVFMECAREERLSDTVPDKVDASLAWFHCGGYYRVKCAWPDPPRE